MPVGCDGGAALPGRRGLPRGRRGATGSGADCPSI